MERVRVHWEGQIFELDLIFSDDIPGGRAALIQEGPARDIGSGVSAGVPRSDELAGRRRPIKLTENG